MPRIKAFRTDTFRCSTCNASYNTLAGASSDWKGLPCGHGSTKGYHNGRPMGPRSAGWKDWCEYFDIDPTTGEIRESKYGGENFLLRACLAELNQTFLFREGEQPRECDACGLTLWPGEECECGEEGRDAMKDGGAK